MSEAKKTEFRSLHDCFIRELKDGARPIDGTTDILVSPCDAIVGACGAIAGTELFQAKGFPYTLQDLLCDPVAVEAHRNGRYVTLRLKSSMYHRFHAPYDGRIDQVIYSPAIPGTSTRSRSSGSSGCSARTNARSCGRRSRPAARP